MDDSSPTFSHEEDENEELAAAADGVNLEMIDHDDAELVDRAVQTSPIPPGGGGEHMMRIATHAELLLHEMATHDDLGVNLPGGPHPVFANVVPVLPGGIQPNQLVYSARILVRHPHCRIVPTGYFASGVVCSPLPEVGWLGCACLFFLNDRYPVKFSSLLVVFFSENRFSHLCSGLSY